MNWPIVDQYGSFVESLQCCNHTEQCTLTTSAAPDDGNELTGVNLIVKIP